MAKKSEGKKSSAEMNFGNINHSLRLPAQALRVNEVQETS
jgi:hypothetical protein